MKIIFSPAKTLNLQNPVQEDWTLSSESKRLVQVLKEQSKEELQKILKVSDTLLEENLEYVKGFDRKVTYRAIEMYDGMAYKSLNVRELPQSSLSYLKDHLLILSAFYGILPSESLVKPYRLDFNTKLKIGGKTLKSYWKDYYNAYIEEGETVFNLASSEFSDLFNKSKFNWIDFDFFQKDGEDKKRHSTISKKARGLLLRTLALNDSKNLDQIKKLEGYGVFFEVPETPLS